MRAAVCFILLCGWQSALPRVGGLVVPMGRAGPAPALHSRGSRVRACACFAQSMHMHMHGRGPAAASEDGMSRRCAASHAGLGLVCAFVRPSSTPAATQDAGAHDDDDARSTAQDDGAARQAEVGYLSRVAVFVGAYARVHV